MSLMLLAGRDAIAHAAKLARIKVLPYYPIMIMLAFPAVKLISKISK